MHFQDGRDLASWALRKIPGFSVSWSVKSRRRDSLGWDRDAVVTLAGLSVASDSLSGFKAPLLLCDLAANLLFWLCQLGFFFFLIENDGDHLIGFL